MDGTYLLSLSLSLAHCLHSVSGLYIIIDKTKESEAVSKLKKRSKTTELKRVLFKNHKKTPRAIRKR